MARKSFMLVSLLSLFLFSGCGSTNVDRGEGSRVDAQVLNEKLGKTIISTKESRDVIVNRAKNMNDKLGSAMQEERDD